MLSVFIRTLSFLNLLNILNLHDLFNLLNILNLLDLPDLLDLRDEPHWLLYITVDAHNREVEHSWRYMLHPLHTCRLEREWIRKGEELSTYEDCSCKLPYYADEIQNVFSGIYNNVSLKDTFVLENWKQHLFWQQNKTKSRWGRPRWYQTLQGLPPPFWTLSQNVSSLALTVWDRQCLEDSERKDDLINKWIN